MSVFADPISPFPGIPSSSYSRFSDEQMEVNPQEKHIHLDKDTLAVTQGRTSHSDNATQLRAGPGGCFDPWIWKDNKEKMNGISSSSHNSKGNIELILEEPQFYVDNDPVSITLGRQLSFSASSPTRASPSESLSASHQSNDIKGTSFGDTTQLSAEPPSRLGHWRWKDDNEKTILAPYDYIASEPGKELRTLLLRNFNAWLQVPEKSFITIVNVIRMLHTASLLIDDIQDNSELRRGRPVAHRIYGIAQTINAGNYVYFQALQELYKLSNPAMAIEIYAAEMLHLHRGQGMELWWRDTLTCPTVDEYLEMVSNKTGGLFRLAIRLMQIESPTSIDCVPLVELMGLIFQIVDDYKNLSDVDYTAKKGVCEDLTEGKFSFPVIHSIRAKPKNSQLLHILAQRTKDIEVKETAVRYIENTGSFDYTRQYVEKLTIQARKVADTLGEGIGGSQGIHTLLDLISIR